MVWLILALTLLWPLVALAVGLAIGRVISASDSTMSGLLPQARRAADSFRPNVVRPGR